MKLPSIKIQLIFFLSILALYLSIIEKTPPLLFSLFITVTAVLFLDSFIIYIKTKHFTISSSSIISGLIIGYVISSQEPWWKLLFACILAICAKHLVRFKSRHLFNPAAFGIFISVILLNATTQWRGASLWYIFTPIGIYFVWKIRKLELAASYMLASFILFGTLAFFQKTPFLDVLKYQNYFFIFVMLIEPKTTPFRRKGKIIFGAGAGILVFILTMIGVRLDAELASLLFLNLFVPALNKWD